MNFPERVTVVFDDVTDCQEAYVVYETGDNDVEVYACVAYIYEIWIVEQIEDGGQWWSLRDPRRDWGPWCSVFAGFQDSDSIK